ncbi:MAG: hypothetical protein ACRCX8_18245 [Sarcina sp.]
MEIISKSDLSLYESINHVDIYMEAWKLRGDAPEIYLEKNKKENLSFWDRCDRKQDDTILRNNKKIVEIYRRYHYDSNVRAEGNKKERFKFDRHIIEAVDKVQKCMRRDITEKGIGIECNPSSNILISTFDRYDEHPIINLHEVENYRENETKMFVSINTDDQGVFDTLLENEYALMALALEKMKKSDGSLKYHPDEIYEWIDKVRRMGLEQSFKDKS